MTDIKCPHCNSVFKTNDTELISVMAQIRDSAFEDAVSQRVKELLNAKVNDAVSKLTVEKANMELKHTKEIDKIKAEYEKEVKELSTELDYYKDLKTKMSTKMVGESLEQYCSLEFEKIRGALPKTVYFEKDSDITSGSKGDFIYREYDELGNEILSIMFEMKNEIDTTKTKHKNEDFFKKLDKDRKDKDCEFAVLVSLLEADSEYYNIGIVDVSHKYEKMYVVRPNHFITILNVLRNASLNMNELRKELSLIKQQQTDVNQFEMNLKSCKDSINKNVSSVFKHHENAIKNIDKVILTLQKMKDDILIADRQLKLSTDKISDLSIKKISNNKL